MRIILPDTAQRQKVIGSTAGLQHHWLMTVSESDELIFHLERRVAPLESQQELVFSAKAHGELTVPDKQ